MALTRFVEKDLKLGELIHRQKYLAGRILQFCEGRDDGFFGQFLILVYREFDFAFENPQESLNTVLRVRRLRLKASDRLNFIHFLVALLRAALDAQPRLIQAIDELEKFRTLLIRHCEKKLRNRATKAGFKAIGAFRIAQNSEENVERSFSQNEIDVLVELKNQHEELRRMVADHKTMEDLPFLNRAMPAPKKHSSLLQNNIREVKDHSLPVSSEQVDTKRSTKNEPLWIEKLDACLTDQFRHQLHETMTNTQWVVVGHGSWGNRLKFFE